jgi:hypothetical protein
LRFLLKNTFKSQLKFDIRQGRVFKVNLTRADKELARYWKVKDPYLPKIDYAWQDMRDKKEENFKTQSNRARKSYEETIERIREILFWASEGKLE